MIHKRTLLLPLFLAAAFPLTCHSQLVIAHRGASSLAPENTIAAFRMAWRLGADGIEGDFYLTRDGHIVCIHDSTTKRTTTSDLDVESSTLDQLRGLDAGQWKGKKWAGQKIPTIREVAATVPPDGVFVIELKSKAQIVPALANEIQTWDLDKRNLLLISFDEATIAACKQRLPDVSAQWLTSFKRRDGLDELRPTARDIAETVERCGADGAGLQGDREVLDAAFVQQLQMGGCERFHVWTIDSPHDALYYKRLGAFAITSNRPALIRDTIAAPAGAP